MKTIKPCKRGNIAERDKAGHCLCDACKGFRYQRMKETRPHGYDREWRMKNKDKVGGYTKKWNKENKEQRDRIVKNWRDKNKAKVALTNSKATKKWYANNKIQSNVRMRARQIAKFQRTPAWANKQAIIDIYKESSRLTKETGIRHEVDHYYPLQGEFVSGLHVENNLQILTRSENRSKGNKCTIF